jgi:P-type conjugative transfer protein TrbL
MPPTEFGVFQDVLSQFQTITATWLGGLYQIGTNLFYMLATIELILVAITGTLRRNLEQLAIDLVRTIAGIMAMFTLFKYGPNFLQNGVILSFTGGASVTGHVPASAMTPGSVMTQGFQLALILLQAIASGWTVFHPSATLNALLLLFSALVILVCFAIIACILLETLVEGYVACVAGTALVATSGTRFTWRFGGTRTEWFGHGHNLVGSLWETVE